MLRRVRWFLVAFSTVMALAPFSGIIAATALAWFLGCEINDVTVERCTGFGADLSPALSGLLTTASLGWVSYSILLVVLVLWASGEAIIGASSWWGRMRSSGNLGAGDFDQAGDR